LHTFFIATDVVTYPLILPIVVRNSDMQTYIVSKGT